MERRALLELKIIPLLLFISLTTGELFSQEIVVIESHHLGCNDTLLIFTPKEPKGGEIPLLYLLHGWSGSYKDWDSKVELQELSDKWGFTIVTPDGFYNSWYLNRVVEKGMQWRDFFHQELYPFIQERYGNRAGNTFITGLSMGGHGAINLFIDNPSLFKAAGSLSGVLNLHDTRLKEGEIEKVLGSYRENQKRYSDNSALFRLEQFAEREPEEREKLMVISCGVDDPLLKSSTTFAEKCNQLNLNTLLITSLGAHSWDYWTKELNYHLSLFKGELKRERQVLRVGEPLKGRLDAIAKQNKIPMIQLAYFDGERRFLSESYSEGYRAPTEGSQTIFQAASLSKTLFATVVLKMAQNGEVNLELPLHNYLPLEKVTPEQQEWAEKLTAEMILTHQTGLPNWMRGPSSEEWLERIIKFNFEPEVAFSYSGEAFYYLQEVVEKIKGASLQEIAKEEIFNPLGMESSSYIWDRPDNPQIDYYQLSAVSFTREGEMRSLTPHPRGNSAYTLRTTAYEYSLFLEALFAGEIIDKEWLEKMLHPTIDAVRYAGRERSCDSFIKWGLGIGVEQHPKLGYIYFHWGDNGTYRALFVALPNKKSHLVYLTNSSRGHDIIEEIISLFYKLESPLQIDSWVNESS